MAAFAKRAIAIASILALVLACTACGQSASNSGGSQGQQTAPSSSGAPAKLAIHKGAAGVALVNLAQDTDRYTAEYASAKSASRAIKEGKADITALPTTDASALSLELGDAVKLIALDTSGPLYIVGKKGSQMRLKDLEGSTVYTTSKITNYILQHLLRWNEINFDAEGDSDLADVKVKSGKAEDIVTRIVAGDIEYAVLSEPQATDAIAQNKDLTRVSDLAKEWSNAFGCDLSLGSVVVRTEFLEANPDAVDTFLVDLSQSAEQVRNDVDASAKLCAEAGIFPDEKTAKAALPYIGATCISGPEVRAPANALLAILGSFGAEGSGITAPPDSFYYIGTSEE